MHQLVDFLVTDQGSVIGFRAQNDLAKEWWDENVYTEGYQWMGSTCYVDHREARALFAILASAGFVLGV